MKSINDWAKEIHALAVQKGWWDKPREIPELLMNCTTELGEAMQEHKNGKGYLYYICENTGGKCEECFLYDTQGHLCPSMLKKPEGIAVEMVDCII